MTTPDQFKPLPPLAELKRRYCYDAETGILTNRFGKSVGCRRGPYLGIIYRQKSYPIHRIAWLMHYGEEPRSRIDHKNGVETDNRIANLRLCDAHTNAFNKKRQSDSSTGIKGVSAWDSGTYRVRIRAHGKNVCVRVRSLDEARAVYARLAQQLHGEFARHD